MRDIKMFLWAEVKQMDLHVEIYMQINANKHRGTSRKIQRIDSIVKLFQCLTSRL